MKTKEVFENFINLNTAVKNFIDNNCNLNFDLENKILFFISCNQNCCPIDIIENFRIKKTNLAIICKSLEGKKLIEKQKDAIDGRAIKLKTTKDGEQVIDNLLKDFESKTTFLSEKEKTELVSNCNAVIKTLKKQI